MIRKYLNNIAQSKKEKITWRSHEVTRIEAFSDGVLAFGVSLLVISLEVPKDSKALMDSLEGLIPFGFCFFGVFWIWKSQYRFFRRYGLHDDVTLGLNAALLFATLAYLYPLKFLFNSALMPNGSYVIQPGDEIKIFVLYMTGFGFINLLFVFMYLTALYKRKAIKLTEVEVFETKTTLWFFLFPVIITIAVIAYIYSVISIDPKYLQVSYYILGLQVILPRWFKRKRERLFKKKFGDIPEVEINRNPEG